VKNLTRSTGSIGVIRAVVGLGKALSMEVLAEGVETVDQRDILREEGCDQLQGYLYSRPCAAQEVQAIISRYAGGTDAPPADRMMTEIVQGGGHAGE
jgi:EAL domain-containing protein (putative c-di-GMP-specific phosphodiesterase class I)